MDALALDESDAIDFIHQVRPIIAGALRAAAPRHVYVVKVDNWFGDRWLGFSNKLLGVAGVFNRKTLRVPPFVPARVRSQRFFVRDTSELDTYAPANAPQQLHIAQTSEHNRRRLMSCVCPDAAAFWWSAATRTNRRGCLMAYLPTDEGHAGWYVELQAKDGWTVSKTRCTTAQELAAYAGEPRELAPAVL